MVRNVYDLTIDELTWWLRRQDNWWSARHDQATRQKWTEELLAMPRRVGQSWLMNEQQPGRWRKPHLEAKMRPCDVEYAIAHLEWYERMKDYIQHGECGSDNRIAVIYVGEDLCRRFAAAAEKCLGGTPDLQDLTVDFIDELRQRAKDVQSALSSLRSSSDAFSSSSSASSAPSSASSASTHTFESSSAAPAARRAFYPKHSTYRLRDNEDAVAGSDTACKTACREEPSELKEWKAEFRKREKMSALYSQPYFQPMSEGRVLDLLCPTLNPVTAHFSPFVKNAQNFGSRWAAAGMAPWDARVITGFKSSDLQSNTGEESSHFESSNEQQEMSTESSSDSEPYGPGRLREAGEPLHDRTTGQAELEEYHEFFARQISASPAAVKAVWQNDETCWSDTCGHYHVPSVAGASRRKRGSRGSHFSWPSSTGDSSWSDLWINHRAYAPSQQNTDSEPLNDIESNGEDSVMSYNSGWGSAVTTASLASDAGTSSSSSLPAVLDSASLRDMDPRADPTWQLLHSRVRWDSSGKARILSYINNLCPNRHATIYDLLEEVLTLALPAIEVIASAKVFRYRHRRRWAREYFKSAAVSYRSVRPPKSMVRKSAANFIERQTEAFDSQAYKSFPFCVPSLREKDFAVAVKVSEVLLTPERPNYPGECWHREGSKQGVVRYCVLWWYDAVNIVWDEEKDDGFGRNTRNAFRVGSSSKKDNEDLGAAATSAVTAAAKPPAISFRYERSDDNTQYMGNLESEMYGCFRKKKLAQKIPSMEVRKSHMIVFDDSLHHRCCPFMLEDPTKPGGLKLVAFFIRGGVGLTAQHVMPVREDFYSADPVARLFRAAAGPEVEEAIMRWFKPKCVPAPTAWKLRKNVWLKDKECMCLDAAWDKSTLSDRLTSARHLPISP